MARENNLSITHIFETHIHADLMSGARELCARVDSAKIFASHDGGARYGFDTEAVKDGDTFHARRHGDHRAAYPGAYAGAHELRAGGEGSREDNPGAS